MSTLKLLSKLEKENKKLRKKCGKLYKFLESDEFTESDPIMQQWTSDQYRHMVHYANCLVKRINLLRLKD